MRNLDSSISVLMLLLILPPPLLLLDAVTITGRGGGHTHANVPAQACTHSVYALLLLGRAHKRTHNTHVHISTQTHVHPPTYECSGSGGRVEDLQHTATHCNMRLQHTATHCNTRRCVEDPQHAASHCSTPLTSWLAPLQHTATHCDALQQTAVCCSWQCVEGRTGRHSTEQTKKKYDGTLGVHALRLKGGVGARKVGWQVVVVCCDVLQCVVACCSVLRCVTVCCSVLQCVAVCCSVSHCVAVCCSVAFRV